MDRQSSYDKVKKNLRGAAKQSKVSKILKDRAGLGDDDDLIDTNELKSSSEGAFIVNSHLRSNKARTLKKRIQNAAVELNRCCGYSVMINAQAPLPVKGPRGGGLSLDLVDKNGGRAPSGCLEKHETHEPRVSKKDKVNRETMLKSQPLAIIGCQI